MTTTATSYRQDRSMRASGFAPTAAVVTLGVVTVVVMALLGLSQVAGIGSLPRRLPGLVIGSPQLSVTNPPASPSHPPVPPSPPGVTAPRPAGPSPLTLPVSGAAQPGVGLVLAAALAAPSPAATPPAITAPQPGVPAAAPPASPVRSVRRVARATSLVLAAALTPVTMALGASTTMALDLVRGLLVPAATVPSRSTATTAAPALRSAQTAPQRPTAAQRRVVAQHKAPAHQKAPAHHKAVPHRKAVATHLPAAHREPARSLAALANRHALLATSRPVARPGYGRGLAGVRVHERLTGSPGRHAAQAAREHRVLQCAPAKASTPKHHPHPRAKARSKAKTGAGAKVASSPARAHRRPAQPGC